jgi:hypothetical protein
MTYSAPLIKYSVDNLDEFEDLVEQARTPRYASQRSRQPKRGNGSKRSKKSPQPHCGIAARRNHRIEW